MPTYQRPGVFVTETLQPITNPITSNSDSVAAFVGESENGGPIGPTLVTSWNQYQALFGQIKNVKTDLAYAVYSFFQNGGSQCYVVRAVDTGGTAASTTLDDVNTLAVLTITAQSVGTWPTSGTSEIFVSVDAAETDGFDLTIDVGENGSIAHEVFTDVTLDPASDRNVLDLVNSTTIGSQYVTASLGSGATGTFGTNYNNPVAVTDRTLSGGVDGTGNPDYVSAVELLENLDQILLLNVPGYTNTTDLTSIVEWAVTQGSVFVVVDCPKPAAGDAASDVSTASTTLVTALPPDSQVSVYAPWLYLQDPGASAPGAVRLTAPGGAVLGQYAKSDVTRGVQKIPAGTGTSLSGVTGPFVNFNGSTLDSLNQASVNVIRRVPGAGFCVMGGRTLKVGWPDRYVNIRRTLMYLEKNLTDLTQFAVFEDNNSVLWEKITDIVSQWLLQQFQLGLMSGATSDQAFYVTCDDSNNTQTSVNSGQVNVEVGVALNSPAEFIVINIGQFDGGATVTES